MSDDTLQSLQRDLAQKLDEVTGEIKRRHQAAPPLVFAEECTSTEALLRKMIVDKISGFEKSVTDLETSISDLEAKASDAKRRGPGGLSSYLAIDKASLSNIKEVWRKWQEKLMVIDNIAQPVARQQLIDTLGMQTNTWTIIDGAISQPCVWRACDMLHVSHKLNHAFARQIGKPTGDAEEDEAWIQSGKTFSEASGGSFGGFEQHGSRRVTDVRSGNFGNLKGNWLFPIEFSADELIRSIQEAGVETDQRGRAPADTRLYIAPGASLVLLKELEKNYKVLYDQ
jgi:hypothetical protein